MAEAKIAGADSVQLSWKQLLVTYQDSMWDIEFNVSH